MRSTQLVLFLVLLNAVAGIAAVALPGPAPITGGGSEIDQTREEQEKETIGTDLPGSELVSAFFDAGSIIQDLRNIVFLGPEMLKNLGAPAILMDAFQAVVVFVVAFDVIEAITGRRLS